MCRHVYQPSKLFLGEGYTDSYKDHASAPLWFSPTHKEDRSWFSTWCLNIEMASIVKLEWEISKMFETVKIEDIFRYYPFPERSAHKKVMSKFEQEELFFWAQGGTSMTLFTTFVAYLNQFIIYPKCCKNNPSTIRMIIGDERNPKTREKLANGEKILEKIVHLNEQFFPQNGDKTVYGKIQFFFKTLGKCCVSCGQNGHNLNCLRCVTRRIQMEEVFHIDEVWTNTGRENIYSTTESLYNRDEDLLYSIGIITTPVHGGRIVSCERGVVARFVGCSSRKREKIATLSKLCINTIIANCEERGIEKLPLPSRLKEGIKDHLHSNERNIGDRVLKGVRGEDICSDTEKNTGAALFYRGPGCFFFTSFPKEEIVEYGELC